MTNYEKYKEWFEEHKVEIEICHMGWGVKDRKPYLCDEICELEGNCYNCQFWDKGCSIERFKWLKAEYESDEVDWSKVPVDTKIEVSNDGKRWVRAHFAKCEGGSVLAWWEGKTSFTAGGITYYSYARLYKGEV